MVLIDNLLIIEDDCLFIDPHLDQIPEPPQDAKMFYLGDIQKKIKKRILLIDDDNDINTGGVFKSEILIGLL